MEVALAVITLSPLDNIAGMLSLVPVPGPSTRPPSANLAEFIIPIAVVILVIIVAIKETASAIPKIPFVADAATAEDIAFPVLIATSANANVFDKIINALLSSPSCSNNPDRAPVI